MFLLGFGIILVTTHGLTHLAVGTLMGMRFTHWFVGKLTQPQPGVKLDYATYLRAPATSRAWMHASGAIVTKLMPFVFLGAAIAAGVPDVGRLGVGGDRAGRDRCRHRVVDEEIRLEEVQARDGICLP